MDLALIDDDTLYQSVFKEYFEDEEIDIIQFYCGDEFIKAPLEEISKIKFAVIDHSILDTTSTKLTKSIKERINAEVCIISTYGDGIDCEELKELGVSGDFKKKDLKFVLDWYNNLKTKSKIITI